jgi:aarF domain-containing kinase
VLYFDRDDKLVTKGMHVQAYVEALAARDPVKTVGDDYVLVARASLLLRGLGHALNQHRSAAAAWRPMADAVLRAAGEDPDALLLAPPAA